MPIAIDSIYKNPDDYKLVPEAFQKAQFSHAPGGKISEKLKKIFENEIQNRERKKMS